VGTQSDVDAFANAVQAFYPKVKFIKSNANIDLIEMKQKHKSKWFWHFDLDAFEY